MKTPANIVLQELDALMLQETFSVFVWRGWLLKWKTMSMLLEVDAVSITAYWSGQNIQRVILEASKLYLTT